jgi:predicted nucleic acid-binding Zn ribbon protein
MAGSRRRRYGEDHGPRPIGTSIDAMVDRLGNRDALALASVFSDWEAICGPRLAPHTRPVRCDATALVVAVDQPAWATQVRTAGPGLLARIAARTGVTPARVEVTVRRGLE